MELHNTMEDLIFRYVDESMKKYDNICKCERCRLDISALSLNNLPSKYTVSDQGKLFNKVKEMESQFVADIVREVTKSIEIVSLNPRHN